MMFKPFDKGVESSAIDDLTLENQTDCISLYGNLQITRDQVGLKTAKALQAFVNDIVMALEQDANLPEKVERQLEGETDNPFL